MAVSIDVRWLQSWRRKGARPRATPAVDFNHKQRLWLGTRHPPQSLQWARSDRSFPSLAVRRPGLAPLLVTSSRSLFTSPLFRSWNSKVLCSG
ncbi:hypothetical protein FA13DRAFT_1730146 [Coprinellus micaceus]|uniref:Uncharacterized protein n=1 Tax=Coprinellus micaceus TaxID=71717 RepID=A0A4Y7TIW8_COPMI|nr:hypothetical protein FA13DRAFT_1730146 [Coprinellus micaceus]